MSLLSDWRDEAYNKEMSTKEGQLFWGNYFAIEKVTGRSFVMM